MAIQSLKCTDTESMFKGNRAKRFVNIESSATRKLAILNRAVTLSDLRVLPGQLAGYWGRKSD